MTVAGPAIKIHGQVSLYQGLLSSRSVIEILMSGHQERGLLMNRDLVVIQGLDIKMDGVGALFARLGRDAHNDGHFLVLRAADRDNSLAGNLDSLQTLDRQG